MPQRSKRRTLRVLPGQRYYGSLGVLPGNDMVHCECSLGIKITLRTLSRAFSWNFSKGQSANVDYDDDDTNGEINDLSRFGGLMHQLKVRNVKFLIEFQNPVAESNLLGL